MSGSYIVAHYLHTPTKTHKTLTILTPMGVHKTLTILTPMGAHRTSTILTPMGAHRTLTILTPMGAHRTLIILTPMGAHKTLTILSLRGGPSLPSQHCFEEKEWLSLKYNNNYIYTCKKKLTDKDPFESHHLDVYDQDVAWIDGYSFFVQSVSSYGRVEEEDNGIQEQEET